MKTGRTLRPGAALAVIALALLAGCAEKPETMIVSAKEYLAKNDRNAAVIQLRNALQKNPDLAEARFLLGRALLDNGELAAAEKELRKAGELGYSYDETVPLLARVLVSRGDYKKAIDEFAKVNIPAPEGRAALSTALGEAYLSSGDVGAARDRFAGALKAQPEYPQALLGQARVVAMGGNLAEATTTVDTALAKSQALPEGWQLKGDLLIGQNQLEPALAAYRKALEVKPDFLPAHSVLVSLLMQQGKLDEAGKQLEAMQKVAPRHPQTLYWEALLAFQQKNLVGARDAIQKQLALAPNNLPGLVLAGRIHNQMGSYAMAETELLKVLKSAPKQQAARMTLVDTYVRMGQASKALDAMKPLLDEPEPRSDVLALAGEVYVRNGDMAKAATYFEKAAALDPANTRKRTAVALSHMALGDVAKGFREQEAAAAADTGTRADLAVIATLTRQRKYDAALNAIATLEKKQPNTAFPHNLRGEVLVAKRDIPGARASFDRALTIEPTNVSATAQLARLDFAEGKPDEAKKRFEALLAKDPKNSKALLMMAALRAKTGGAGEEIATLIGKAVAANPSDPEPRLALIAQHLTAGEPKKSVAAAQEAVTALPDNPDILNALGRAQQIAGDTNSAIATYNRIAQLLPDSATPFMRIAELQMLTKDHKGARESLRKALAVKPDLFEAQRRLVALELDAGAVPSALAVAREVQKQHPKESVGYLLEGDIHAKKKNWSEAIASYRNGLKVIGTADLAIRLTAALRESGNAAEADKITASWLKEHPADRAFPSYLAETALAKKDYAGAARLYRTLVQSNPKDAASLNNLAWVSGQLKDPKALEYAEKANELAPDNAGILDTLSELLLDKGSVKRAVELQQRAVALAPDNAGLRMNLARALIKDGQKEAAKKELTLLAKLGDRYPNQATVAKMMQGL